MTEIIFAVLFVSLMGLTRCYKTTVFLHFFEMKHNIPQLSCIKALTPAMMQLHRIEIWCSNRWDNVSYMCAFVWLLVKNRSMTTRRVPICKCIGRVKCRWSLLKQWWTCTSHINLMGFYPVLLQLMWLHCVQQASISTQVDSSTFTRTQHVVFQYYSLRGRHSMTGWLCWALPHISTF